MKTECGWNGKAGFPPLKCPCSDGNPSATQILAFLYGPRKCKFSESRTSVLHLTAPRGSCPYWFNSSHPVTQFSRSWTLDLQIIQRQRPQGVVFLAVGYKGIFFSVVGGATMTAHSFMCLLEVFYEFPRCHCGFSIHVYVSVSVYKPTAAGCHDLDNFRSA